MQRSLASIKLKQSSTQRELICCWLDGPLAASTTSGTLPPSLPLHILFASALLFEELLYFIFSRFFLLPAWVFPATASQCLTWCLSGCMWLVKMFGSLHSYRGRRRQESWQRQPGGDLRPGLQRADVMLPLVIVCFLDGIKPGGTAIKEGKRFYNAQIQSQKSTKGNCSPLCGRWSVWQQP